MCGPNLSRWIFIFLTLNSYSVYCHAQRIYLPPTPDFSPPPLVGRVQSPPQAQAVETTLVLKTYPDGTKKVVALEALNFHDNGAAFGGPPQLSLFQAPTLPSPSTDISQKNPGRLNLAPIGTLETATQIPASFPASPDPLAGATSMAAADPMGGGIATDPMGGSVVPNPVGKPAAPVDPLAGSATKTAPPLQTVSGKPAPIVGDTTLVQLGEWESFFLNAGIGACLQGQLTARRVDNGVNRQAYPYTYPTGALVSGENFTFNPGFRLDMEFGYNFYEWLGVELQTGLTYNGLNQYNATITRFPPGSVLPPGSYNMSADGELVQVPIQLNGILRWPGNAKFRPFVGGGVGAIWQQLDVNNYYLANTDIQGNYCRSGFQFGWNAQVGATYTVEPGVDFYGAFKLLSAFMPVIGNYQFENTYNFAVEVGIQSRF